MMAVEELTAPEGTQYGVNAVVHYVMCTDRRQCVSLQRNPEPSTDYTKETAVSAFSLSDGQ